MTHYYATLTISNGRVGITIHRCKLMHSSPTLTYVCVEGESGWRRHDGPLFADRDEAVVDGIFQLRTLSASADAAREELARSLNA